MSASFGFCWVFSSAIVSHTSPRIYPVDIFPWIRARWGFFTCKVSSDMFFRLFCCWKRGDGTRLLGMLLLNLRFGGRDRGKWRVGSIQAHAVTFWFFFLEKETLSARWQDVGSSFPVSHVSWFEGSLLWDQKKSRVRASDSSHLTWSK